MIAGRDAYIDSKDGSKTGKEFYLLEDDYPKEAPSKAIVKRCSFHLALLSVGGMTCSVGSCTLFFEDGVNHCVFGLTNFHCIESTSQLRVHTKIIPHQRLQRVHGVFSCAAFSARTFDDSSADKDHLDFFMFRFPGLNGPWEENCCTKGNILHGIEDDDGDPIDDEGNKMVTVGSKIFMLSHPLGGHARLSFGEVKEIRGYEFTHDLSSTPGSSGAPIFTYEGTIIGIHFRRTLGIKIQRISDQFAQKTWEKAGNIFSGLEKKILSVKPFKKLEVASVNKGEIVTMDHDDFNLDRFWNRFFPTSTWDDSISLDVLARQLKGIKNLFPAKFPVKIFKVANDEINDEISQCGPFRLGFTLEEANFVFVGDS